MPRPRNTTCQPRLRKRGTTYTIYFTSQGVTKKISTHAKDRASAELALAEFIAQSQNTAQFSAIPTISEILNAYEKQKDKEGKIESVRHQLKPLHKFFGHLVAESISDNVVDAYFSFRENIKTGTIRRELSILAAALNYAKQKNIIQNSPKIHLPQQSPAREYWITKEEYQALLAEAKKSFHLFVFISLAIGTLARKGAILGLTWDRVNFETGLIDLIDPEIRITNKRRATVPMNDTLRAVLLQAKQAAQTDHVVEYHGKPVDDIKKAFQRCAKRAGLPRVTPHILRHSGATWLAMAGIPMYEIARYLGHTDIKTTYRIYAKYSPDYLRSASAVLA